MYGKQKGNAFEREVAAEFRLQLGGFAARNAGSGSGIAKSDVHNDLGLNLECKRVERLNIFKAIFQSERDAEKAHSKPTVVFRANRMEEPYIAIRLSHFFELFKAAREPKTFKTDNQRLQYLLRQARTMLNNLLKEIEE